MDLQKFNPKIFINNVQRLCGSLSPTRLQLVQNFALNIGDQSKLNQCFKHANILTKGLPQEEIWLIFSVIFAVHRNYRAEKDLKPIMAHEKRRLAKEKDRHLKTINKAIVTLKSLNPDPSRFDAGYLLNLAKEKVAEMGLTPALAFPLIEPKEPVDLRKPFLKKKKPKGYEIVNILIYGVHDMVKRHGSTLTDNAICNRLASLLTILTGNKYSRENVLGILRRKPKTP